MARLAFRPLYLTNYCSFDIYVTEVQTAEFQTFAHLQMWLLSVSGT